MKISRLSVFLIAFSLALGVSACGGMSSTKPRITVQPQSQSVTAGSSVTFSVTATGSMPLSYQWSKDGVILNGATSSSYTIPSAVLQDDGSTWWVMVSNSAGSVMSNTATLHVTLLVP